MCGRLTLRTPQSRLAEQFALSDFPQLPLRFNIAPSQDVLVIRQSEDSKQRETATPTWGFVPSWSKDPNKGQRPINARGETVAEKPTFRTAFKRRRCLVPADGYFEWQKSEDGKQPYYIKMADDGPFAFAGLWEHWHRDGQSIESFTIITTASNDLTRSIHHRMPVILPPEAYDIWLDAEFADHTHLVGLLRPFDSEAMQVHAVGREVNRPTYDNPKCIAAVNPPDAGDKENAAKDAPASEGGKAADGWLF
jgi:putative SOS response-associated peptidase YedK